MRTIGAFTFPSPRDETECAEWKPYVTRIALHRQVLVVAKTRIEGTWKAYCAPVLGENHDEEWRNVLRCGSQLPENWGRALFPELKEVPYAR